VEERLDIVAAIAQALKRGMAEGVFRPIGPKVVATNLFTVVHGAADVIAAGDPPERWLEAVRDLTRQWLGSPA
jgi:hypothetical protein